MLCIANCFLGVGCCLPVVVCCLLSVLRRVLFVVCRVLVIDHCCLLFADMWGLSFVV